MKEKIEKLIDEQKIFADRYKTAMSIAQQQSDKLGKYELTELLNRECSISFNKAYYFSLTRIIGKLEKILNNE